jgi:stress-induced morphogen
MGQITAEILTKKLLESFPDARVKASDMTGGGDHWQVLIESAHFKGKSLVEQHQLVYKALGDWMKKEIHALALTTKAL